MGKLSGQLCGALHKRLLGGGGGQRLLRDRRGNGRAVCGRAAIAARCPLASNMKLFTTATALTRFRPESRLPTHLLTSGRLDPRGVLHGNLYLKGGGDPALAPPPSTTLSWAASAPTFFG